MCYCEIIFYKIKEIYNILGVKPALAWKWYSYEIINAKGKRKSLFTKEEKDFLCEQTDGKVAGLDGASSRELKKLFVEKFKNNISHTTVNSILNNGL